MVYGFGDLNYKDRLSLLELPSLEERRVRGDFIESFKLLIGIAKLDYSLFQIVWRLKSYRTYIQNSSK